MSLRVFKVYGRDYYEVPELDEDGLVYIQNGPHASRVGRVWKIQSETNSAMVEKIWLKDDSVFQAKLENLVPVCAHLRPPTFSSLEEAERWIETELENRWRPTLWAPAWASLSEIPVLLTANFMQMSTWYVRAMSKDGPCHHDHHLIPPNLLRRRSGPNDGLLDVDDLPAACQRLDRIVGSPSAFMHRHYNNHYIHQTTNNYFDHIWTA